MNELALWQSTRYVQIVTAVTLFLFLVGGTAFFLQKRDPKWISVWASVKSWVLTAPVVFFFMGLPSPWPLVFIVMGAIFGSKTFFRMTGMYHRSWFVWLTYVFIALQGYVVYRGYEHLYNIMPMIFLALSSMIPILRNSYTQMIQYIALSLINFIIMGWGFMFMGRIVLWERGPLIALYLIILFEFCESANYAITRSIGRTKPFGNITTRFSVEGFIGSMILTLLVAWAIRYLLPDTHQAYWISAGLIVSIVGRLGGIALSVIRRDLNIKEAGIFIIGRDDILARIDKPMFAAPLIYFVFLMLKEVVNK